MFKLTSKTLIAIAAASLACTPMGAHAKTRAGDSKVVYTSAKSNPGKGKDAKGEKLASNGSFFAGIMVGLWVAGVVAVAVDDDGERQSAGT